MWLFGGEHPTVLDAHVAVFIARLLETEHEDFDTTEHRPLGRARRRDA